METAYSLLAVLLGYVSYRPCVRLLSGLSVVVNRGSSRATLGEQRLSGYLNLCGSNPFHSWGLLAIWRIARRALRTFNSSSYVTQQLSYSVAETPEQSSCDLCG